MFHDANQSVCEISTAKGWFNRHINPPSERVSFVASNMTPTGGPTVTNIQSFQTGTSGYTGYARVNSTSHGYSAGDIIMIYDFQNLSSLGDKTIEYLRGGTTRNTASYWPGFQSVKSAKLVLF